MPLTMPLLLHIKSRVMYKPAPCRVSALPHDPRVNYFHINMLGFISNIYSFLIISKLDVTEKEHLTFKHMVI